MNPSITQCSPQVTLALIQLREMIQDGKIDVATYNRKVLELQASVDSEKLFQQTPLTHGD